MTLQEKLQQAESTLCEMIMEAQDEIDEAAMIEDVAYRPVTPEDAAPELDDLRGIVRDALDEVTPVAQHSEHFGNRYNHANYMSEANIHTAMDIWEAVFDTRNNDEDFYDWFTQEGGRNEGVEIAMTIAPQMNEAYELLGDDYDEAFDFEFVPAMMNLLHEHSGGGLLPIYEFDQIVWNTIAQSLVAAKCDICGSTDQVANNAKVDVLLCSSCNDELEGPEMRANTWSTDCTHDEFEALDKFFAQLRAEAE